MIRVRRLRRQLVLTLSVLVRHGWVSHTDSVIRVSRKRRALTHARLCRAVMERKMLGVCDSDLKTVKPSRSVELEWLMVMRV